MRHRAARRQWLLRREKSPQPVQLGYIFVPAPAWPAHDMDSAPDAVGTAVEQPSGVGWLSVTDRHQSRDRDAAGYC